MILLWTDAVNVMEQAAGLKSKISVTVWDNLTLLSAFLGFGLENTDLFGVTSNS